MGNQVGSENRAKWETRWRWRRSAGGEGRPSVGTTVTLCRAVLCLAVFVSCACICVLCLYLCLYVREDLVWEPMLTLCFGLLSATLDSSDLPALKTRHSAAGRCAHIVHIISWQWKVLHGQWPLVMWTFCTILIHTSHLQWRARELCSWRTCSRLFLATAGSGETQVVCVRWTFEQILHIRNQHRASHMQIVFG